MISVSRIRRDFDEAGSVNSLLTLWGFVDDQIFMTKAGHVGLVYRLQGVDYECLDDRQRRDVVHRFEAALRVLDEQCRVYQYLCKRRIAPFDAKPCAHPFAHAALERRTAYLNARCRDLYEIDLFLVLVYEGLRPRWITRTHLQGVIRHPAQAVREWLSPPSVLK